MLTNVKYYTILLVNLLVISYGYILIENKFAFYVLVIVYLCSQTNHNMTTIEKELASIGETYSSFADLNQNILQWGEKRGWYIVLNRVPKKGWILYGLQDGGRQLFHEFGLPVLESYFDSPVTMLNRFISQ